MLRRKKKELPNPPTPPEAPDAPRHALLAIRGARGVFLDQPSHRFQVGDTLNLSVRTDKGRSYFPLKTSKILYPEDGSTRLDPMTELLIVDSLVEKQEVLLVLSLSAEELLDLHDLLEQALPFVRSDEGIPL